ncbi:MAG TPA: DICT sensory domain-containing protein [Solirubrobacteraceae bacterium]|nr:DICT sensory domain-containing protein [Solirubrobacteraceae bacterium]
MEEVQQTVTFPGIEGSNGELSTAQLAQRTGVPAGTLRMWESRYDFPAPTRLPGGHRRYSERDVEQVREVARLRGEGLSMAAAIERLRQANRPTPVSVFAGLRERHPEVAPAVMSKRALLGLTHALEDEFCARAATGFALGCFQRERFYRQAERRWGELARTADLVVAVADFPALREPAGGAIEVPVDAGEAMAREWTLVLDAPGSAVCLAAWEHAGSPDGPDMRRQFEVLWSFEPPVVRSATYVAEAVLGRFAPEVAARIPGALRPPGPPLGPELRFASSLAHRMVGYLGALLDPPQRVL